MWEFTGTPRFELRRKLGAGGMGAVYEVWDRERRQRVALKTLTRLGPNDVIRFKREFRTLSAIIHPHLVRLYELIGEGEHWFFTMELLEGAQPLLSVATAPANASAVTETATEPMETVTMTTAGRLWEASAVRRMRAPVLSAEYLDCMRGRFRQLAEAVGAIHKAGKLHRDLKPSNVMVKPDGSVIILDFGLSLDLSAARSRSESPQPSSKPASRTESWESYESGGGTILYMAPEQALGMQLSEASDWYAFGATLYQCLTGRCPFEEHGREILARKLAADGPRPSLIARHVPEDLDTLAEQLMRRNPTERAGAEKVLAVLGSPDRSPSGTLPHPAVSDLVGREPQMRQLRTAVEGLRLGQPSVLQVHGPSGFGKSTLILHFLEELQGSPDTIVLSGRCYEQEAMPYKAADSVVDSLALHLMRHSADLTLPPSAGALAQLFPVLSRVHGFPAPAAVGPGEFSAVRREAFRSLREIFAVLGEQHTLIIVIDDVQWADADSALLLEEVFPPDHMPRALLICSHRSEYTGPFISRLEALHPQRVEVGPLAAEEASDLARRLLGGTHHPAASASRVAEASGGSPYFVAELVQQVREGRSVPENLDLDSALRRRVELLPESSRRLLEVVAVAGSPIELRSVQEACPESADPLSALADLRYERLVRSSGVAGENFELETYHDRVRESILAGLRKDVRKTYHGRLATVLEAHGRAAAESLAFHYENAGVADTAVTLYRRAADESIRSLALNRAEALLRKAADLSGDLEQRTSALERLVHLQTDAGRFRDAYSTGREAARAWGVKLPSSFIPPLFIADLLQFAFLRLGKNMEQLAEYRRAADTGSEMAVRLMAAVGKAAYQIRPELCISVMVKIVNLCLRRGATPDCSIGFMAFGAIFLGGILGRHRTGAEFGKQALRLVERFHNDAQRAEVNFVVGYFGTSWQSPVIEAERLWGVALEAGQASGDLFHTGCAACATVLSQFMRGVPLPDIWDISGQHQALVHKYRLKEPEGGITAVRQAIRNLRNETRSPDSLSDAEFDEAAFRHQLDVFGSRHFALFYHVARMQVLVLRGLFSQAVETFRDGETFARDARGMLHGAEYSFYGAVAALAPHSGATAAETRGARRALREFRRLAQQCPANFLSRARFLEAELARSRGQDAPQLYQQAMLAADACGHLHLAGLAAHRCGDVAAARSYFEKWGAPALLHQETRQKGTSSR